MRPKIKKTLLLYITVATLTVSVCMAANKEADFSCAADSNDANIVNLTIRILPRQDPIYKVYGFDAASGDTSLSANRIDTCVQDTSGISDPDVDAIIFDLAFDITGSTFECGATLTDLSGVSGVKVVTVVLRAFAYSETMLSGDDDVFVFTCRTDDLNQAFVSAGSLNQGSVDVPNVIVQRPNYGAYLRIRDAETDAPLTTGSLNQDVYMSVEFYPELQFGPDTYGSTFYIGFLGNDVQSGTSESSLFIVVIPKYQGRTDVMVTTASGTQLQNVSDGSPITFNLSTDLMGCSDGGMAEIDYKGVKVYSFDSEVAVLVYNRESDTEDMYTALPLDVLGTRYYTVSMPAINDTSELMIIGTENGTAVTLTIPATTTLSVTFNGTTSSAGDTVSFTLNEMQTFHLGVSSSTMAESVTGYLVTSDLPVAVISGNRAYSNDHLVDQMSPTTQLGDHYILTPADPVGDSRVTTYIVQATASGDTIVTRYLSSTTHENYTITLTTNPVKTITVAHDEPCEIVSDQVVMVTQIVSPPPGANTDFEPAMLVMPPVYRWSNEYVYHHKDYLTKIVWVTPSSDTVVQINGGDSAGDTIDVLGPEGYKFYSTGISLPGNTKFTLSTSTANNKLYTFLPIAYPSKNDNKNTGSVYIPAGVRHADKGNCSTVGYRGDLLDNDCDGRIDEEIADGLDNDQDLLFDEDTLTRLAEFAGTVAIRPFNCSASGTADFSDPDKLIILTKADGCYENRTGPFAMTRDFENVVTSNIGSNTQPKQLKSGNFTLAKFVDSPILYFRCDTRYCFSSTDDDCRVICSTSTRRKRQEEEITDNVTTNIWIYPFSPGGSSSGTNQNQSDVIITTQDCLENTNIQIILSVLLALLLLAITTASCFCCLFRRRRNIDKKLSKYTTYSGTSTTSHTPRQLPTRYRF